MKKLGVCIFILKPVKSHFVTPHDLLPFQDFIQCILSVFLMATVQGGLVVVLTMFDKGYQLPFEL